MHASQVCLAIKPMHPVLAMFDMVQQHAADRVYQALVQPDSAQCLYSSKRMLTEFSRKYAIGLWSMRQQIRATLASSTVQPAMGI